MKEFEITKVFGDIGSKKDRGRKGTLKLCKVRWEGSHPMYDLRIWDEEGKPMRGLSFTGWQMKKLKDILNEIEIGDENVSA